MNSTTIISKTNMTANRDGYSELIIAWCMKLKLKMFMTILVRIKKCLILVITMLYESIMMIKTH